MIVIELGVGLVLLVLGGEAVVRGSVALARRLGISPLLVGLVLVGFGTSTPELVASLRAALAGAPGIAVGTIVGSNIANILLVLGLAAAIGPVATHREAFWRDSATLLAASLLLLAGVLSGSIGRPFGVGLVVALALYAALAYLRERRGVDPGAAVHEAEAGLAARPALALAVALVLTGAGIAALLSGAAVLVAGAVDLARRAGLSEAVIGLSLVAFGTSLPELATALVATLRRQPDVAFGNIVGSSIFNILGIVGLTAAVHPLAVPAEIARFDIWVMLAAAVLFVLFAATGWRISRGEGWAFLAAYAAFLGVRLGGVLALGP